MLRPPHSAKSHSQLRHRIAKREKNGKNKGKTPQNACNDCLEELPPPAYEQKHRVLSQIPGKSFSSPLHTATDTFRPSPGRSSSPIPSLELKVSPSPPRLFLIPIKRRQLRFVCLFNILLLHSILTPEMQPLPQRHGAHPDGCPVAIARGRSFHHGSWSGDHTNAC